MACQKTSVGSGGGVIAAGIKLGDDWEPFNSYFDRTAVWLRSKRFYSFPCVLSVSSWPWLPSQPNALQPGSIHPWTASVPSAASRHATAKRSTCTNRLPGAAGIQPGLCRTTTQDWIMYHNTTYSATLNVLQYFPTRQDWKHVISIKMTFVSQLLDSSGLVVNDGEIIVLMQCICSVEELPSENVDRFAHIAWT